MNLGYKGLAIGVIAIGAVVVGAYTLGTKQTGSQSAKTVDINMPADHGGAPSAGAQAVNGNFTHFRVGNRNVKSMLDMGREVWVGSSGGIIQYDIAKDDYKLVDTKSGHLLSNGIFHMSRWGDQVMVGTYGGGMSVFNTKTQQWKNYNIPDGLADQFVYDVQQMDNGDLWIATWSGANLIKGGNLDDAAKWQTFTVENTKGGLPNDWVYGVEKGRNGDVWLATEAGLALYQNGKWTNWQHKDGLGADYELVKDDISFTNDPGQASKHHAQQKSEQGLTNINVAYNPNYIISMVLDKNGNVWCGTWGGGLARFDGKKWVNFTVKDGLPGNHIFMLQIADDGDLWVGTNKGLVKRSLDGKTNQKILTKADGLFADNVFSMAKTADGSMWIGSFGGVARLLNMN